MPRSPGPLYRQPFLSLALAVSSKETECYLGLACTLSLAQIASGLATIFVYEIEDARYSQFIAILYAINTCYMVSTLIPHTTQKDNDPVNKLNKQFVIINFLLLCWILSVGLVPLTVGAGITHALYPCAAASFLSPKCVAVGLDIGLPFALIATLGTISYNIYHSAGAVQAAQEAARASSSQSRVARPFKLRPSRMMRGASAAGAVELV
ncbi:hypothetical protein C8R47DRAFT_1158567 [Mycena vitilis]|nr:hypothetical protein C8R47DRAFT_1158567 [Mycena vitilis]